MKRVLLIILLVIYSLFNYAQDFNQSVINTLQSCIQQKQYERADSIINSFRGKELPETSVFWLNLIHSDVGICKYRMLHDVTAYLPYVQSGIDAFNFISHYVNKENASNTPDLWSILCYWSEIYSQLDNKIVDSISVFSDKYYNEYEKKDPTLYYLTQQKIYQHYFDKQEWSKCINIMSQVENGIKENVSAITLAYSRFDIGQAYMNMKDYYSAEKWYMSSYNAFSSIDRKEDDETYCCLLLLLSKLYARDIVDFEKGYNYSLEAERVNEKLFGITSKMYITSLAYLSESELGLNLTNESLAHLERLVDLLNDASELDTTEKQMYREKLNLMYLRLNIKKDIVSHDTLITDNTLLLEASNAFTHGSLQEAIYKFSLLQHKYESDFHSIDIGSYVYVTGSLSNALVKNGEYIKADSLLNVAIAKIQEKDINTPLIRGLYEARGLLYCTINNIDLALRWYNMAKELYTIKEKKGIQYAMLLSNLSLCYVANKDFSTAKQLSDEAYNLCIQFYGDNADSANDRLLLLNNLAMIYYKMTDFSKSKGLYEEVVRNCISSQYEATKALALMNLSEIYLLIEKDNKKAEECLLQVLALDAESYVRDMAEFNLYFLHCITHSNDAKTEIAKYNESIKNRIANMFSYFSESEREDYWTQKSQALVFLNNLALLTFDNNQTRIMAYNNALFTKNMLLNSGRLLGNIVKDSDDETRDTYSCMQTLKNALSKKGMPKDSMGSYIERISQLEKQIASSIPNFSDKLIQQFKTTSDIQNMLSDDEIAIEFVFLPQIKTPFEDSELRYGALILTKDSDVPILVPLCSEYDLEYLFDVDNSNNQDFVDKLYDIKDTRLYDLVWVSIEPYIPKGKIVYYSPTGYISKINLSAISNGSYRLHDIFEIHEVSTTATIGELKEHLKRELSNAILFGDINYYEDADIMAENAKAYQYVSSGNVLATRSLTRSTWDLLPSTKDEIMIIAKLLSSKGIETQTISQNSANEESFKAMNGNAPDIIHVASHGFYYQSIEDITSSFFSRLNSYTQKDYSLLFSGLLFAGANNAWIGRDIAEDIEDGILTADEISRLDLEGNKLLVLSACDTGLGDLDNIDGVFGLQRGFKKAGAETILMSLWKVPDEETGLLMKYFYEYYLSGKTTHESLKHAQGEIIKMGKSPYYWAGFVLLD